MGIGRVSERARRQGRSEAAIGSALGGAMPGIIGLLQRVAPINTGPPSRLPVFFDVALSAGTISALMAAYSPSRNRRAPSSVHAIPPPRDPPPAPFSRPPPPRAVPRGGDGHAAHHVAPRLRAEELSAPHDLGPDAGFRLHGLGQRQEAGTAEPCRRGGHGRNGRHGPCHSVNTHCRNVTRRPPAATR